MTHKKRPPHSDAQNDDSEFVLDDSSLSDSAASHSEETEVIGSAEPTPASSHEPTQVAVGRPKAPLVQKGSGGYQPMNSELTLRQAEHLRTAQRRVQELEKEVDQVRRQHEELYSAADALRSSKEQLEKKLEKQKLDYENMRETAQAEARILREAAKHRDGEIQRLKKENQELQERLDQSFRQVRKREKELEHRLEILKMDGQAVLRTKDEALLELKEKIDSLQYEKERLGQRNYGLHQELEEKEAVLRRISRALRLALVQLEGEDRDSEGAQEGPQLIPVKKAK